MQISLRLEGGLGDIICASRFVPAIKEKYPQSFLTAYLDTEGNPMQENALREFYPDIYDKIITIPNKKYKSFMIDSQFGLESHFGGIENIPDNLRNEMLNHDKFYDLHIDGMKWVSYDFNWKRFFYFFPKPRLTFDGNENSLPEKFALFHLASNTSRNTNISEPWYLKGLVSAIAKDIPCLVIHTPDTDSKLACLSGFNKNVTFVSGSLSYIAYVISKSSIFVGVDSGLKYMANGFGIPSIIFATQCFAPHQVPPAQKLRWLHFSEDYMPVHYDYKYVANYANRILQNPAVSLAPSSVDFSRDMVVRDYVVNIDKSSIS